MINTQSRAGNRVKLRQLSDAIESVVGAIDSVGDDCEVRGVSDPLASFNVLQRDVD